MMNKTILKEWVDAARPRTLPLSLSSALMGSFMALSFRQFSWSVFILALLTTVLLQILANLANDYGDALSGVDNKERIGPKRGLQRGAISLHAMKNAIFVTIILSVISGIWLILEGLHYRLSFTALIYLLVGLGAILAAIKYTVGRNPYGYVGWGDFFVFIFFGPVGVAGTYYLHTNAWDTLVCLPSISLGLFSVAVLNINNMRDLYTDASWGKKTIPVLLGPQKAKIYHLFILLFAEVAFFIYVYFRQTSILQWLTLLNIPWFALHLIRVFQIKSQQALDPELKKVSMGTIITVLLYGIGSLWVI